MLTEEEHKDMLEKQKKLKQLEGINSELERQKSSLEDKLKNQAEKVSNKQHTHNLQGKLQYKNTCSK